MNQINQVASIITYAPIAKSVWEAYQINPDLFSVIKQVTADHFPPIDESIIIIMWAAINECFQKEEYTLTEIK